MEDGAGFRSSHEQAQESHGIALAVPERTTPGVTSHHDPGVAVTALLSRNLEATRTWVWEVLAELARDDAGEAVLRETMRTFVLAGESYQRTSELLIVHCNTVKYRVAKVLADRRSSLERTAST